MAHEATISAADANMALEEPIPLDQKPKTYLDLINECDNFPYYHSNPEAYTQHLAHYYAFKVASYPDVELGYILPFIAETLRGVPNWKVDDDDRSVLLLTGTTEAERSQAIAITTGALRLAGDFNILKGWRDELYPVYGLGRELLFSIERSASALFGVLTYGCHMTAYTRNRGDQENQLRIWVPKRAATKQTYGGMLDNTVAGGLATGETAIRCIVRESAEEASLPEDIVRDRIQAAGTVTYFHIRDERAGGETGLLQPECQFVYDLELPDDITPKPSDDEVESFELMTVEQVKGALSKGEFKPNCALVMLDFFVRHGILTADDESYIEIVARLHRILEFPSM